MKLPWSSHAHWSSAGLQLVAPHDPGTHMGTTRVGFGTSASATAFEGAALVVVEKNAIHSDLAVWLREAIPGFAPANGSSIVAGR